MSSDIDSLVGWLSDPNAITKGEAHSGQYALRVDQGHEFSPGYTAILGQLSASRIKGVRLDAWAYSPNDHASGQVVITINDMVGGSAISRQTIDYGSAVPAAGKWVKITKEIMFPATINYASQMVIYLWRGSPDTVAYLDDIQLTALR